MLEAEQVPLVLVRPISDGQGSGILLQKPPEQPHMLLTPLVPFSFVCTSAVCNFTRWCSGDGLCLSSCCAGLLQQIASCNCLAGSEIFILCPLEREP